MKNITKRTGMLLGSFLLIFIVFQVVSIRLDDWLYDYKPYSPNHEVDSVFTNNPKCQINVERSFRSTKGPTISFINCDQVSKLVVERISITKDYQVDEIKIESKSEIKLTQLKTYTALIVPNYPIVQNILNPRNSKNFKLVIEEPNQFSKMVLSQNSILIRGNFKFVALNNSQNVCIISFRLSENNEIMILKQHGELFIIFQSVTTKSLLEIVNPLLLP
jgi:hypothetical protein